ncbi:flavin-dependent monooxygenase [Oleomonas cavernae]|uniref:Flavin-dependent monooxygenase n=1 Tax=Oleomonas cavernae TaxID=2320859 RepID=A0A418WE36_9PROT|nr:flavin-dependent monooxygenase [Oleomonas cavernae]RJF88283.1 flavin-dependent monooxygenase [Oleomonas cavernae]
MDGSSEAEIIAIVPTAEEILRRARALIPALKARAEESGRQRRLPAETIAEMQAAGLFRVLQPKRWGGYEMHPNVFYDVLMALAEGDMSAAWCYGVIGCHNWQMALFDDQAGQDVWGKDTSVLISSTYMMTGKAMPVEGGYTFNGRWRFSSGCEHCDWIFLGGLVDPESGNLDARTFLLPRKDYEIVDTWDTHGLRGTGSHDIVVKNVFVPEYRTHKMADGLMCNSPGNAINTASLFRMPFAQIFIRSVSTAAIGALQAMLDAFLEYGAKRTTVTGAKTAEDGSAQLVCAETVAAIDEMKLVLRRNMDVMYDQAARGEFTEIPQRMMYRFQSAEVPERCSNLAQRLFKAGGGAAVFHSKPFARIFADISTARAHAANQMDSIGRNWGGVMLGLDNTDFFI